MKDPFESSFNNGLDDAQTVLGAKFIVGTNSYEAVSIDKLTIAERGMPGGKFQDVSVVIVARVKVAVAAGVKDGLKLSALGENLRVIGIEKEGDDSWTLLCGSTGVEVPRRLR